MAGVGLDVLAEGDEVAIRGVLAGDVVRGPGCIAPNCVAADW